MTFSDADLEAIRRAVQGAEGKTSGEIVPFITRRSSRYAAAAWRAGAVFGLAGALAAWAFRLLQGDWHATWADHPSFLHGVAAATAVLGFVLGRRVDPVVRLFAGRGTIDLAVHRRAMQAFVEEEVFLTRERTGILLFISLLERRIEVFGDSGINARVSADEWVEVVALARDGIRAGRAAEGIVAAVGRCGELLRSKGVDIRTDDANELPDRLRIDRGD